MNSNKKVYIVEKTIYTGRLDILEFADSSPDRSYFDYLSKKKEETLDRYSLSLLGFTDLFLRRRLVEYLYDCITNQHLLPGTFIAYRIIPVRKLIENFPDQIEKPYQAFLDTVDLCFTHRAGSDGLAFISTFRKFCVRQDHKDNYFELDEWSVHDFHLSEDRIFSRYNQSVSFSGIRNEHNKFLVKKYIHHCLTNTGNSISTIYGRCATLKALLNQRDASINLWTEEDAQAISDYLTSTYSRQSTIVTKMINLYGFIDYLLVHDFISDNPMKKHRSLTTLGRYQYKFSAPDQHAVAQLFQVLGKLDEKLVIWFLIIYCTGMRVSEAAAIKKDCLEHRDSAEFIRYYSIKMKKDVSNVIPLALSEMIEGYRKTVDDSEYLFPIRIKAYREKSKHSSGSSLADQFRKAIAPYHIQNADGSEYRFAPHSFRHLMASKMRSQEIPFQFIQEQLHHNSPDMTLAYIEYMDRQKIEKMERFIDNAGIQHEIVPDIPYTADMAYADYLRKFINAQMLPNGVCARPVKLGKCPHCNACLNCAEFRTSPRNLPAHRDHLHRVEEYLDLAKKNDWLPQIKSNELIRTQLLQIIDTLEKMEASGDENSICD